MSSKDGGPKPNPKPGKLRYFCPKILIPLEATNAAKGEVCKESQTKCLQNEMLEVAPTSSQILEPRDSLVVLPCHVCHPWTFPYSDVPDHYSGFSTTSRTICSNTAVYTGVSKYQHLVMYSGKSKLKDAKCRAKAQKRITCGQLLDRTLVSDLPCIGQQPGTSSAQVLEAKANFGLSKRVSTLGQRLKSGSAGLIQHGNVSTEILCRTTLSVNKKLTKEKSMSSKGGEGRLRKQKRYHCPHCEISCSNQGQLRGHIRKHTGEKPHACSFDGCQRRFARNEELTRHYRIHTGVKPYQCDKCTKKFGRRDHLSKHLQTHQNTGSRKPFECKACNQGYSRADALKRHQKKVHNKSKDSDW